MLESPDFPSRAGLRSRCSAGALTLLFAAFVATMPTSDFFIPYISGFGVATFPSRSCTNAGQYEDLPGPDKVCACVSGVLDTVGPPILSP